MPPPRLPEVGRNLVNQRGAASGANSENNLPGKIQCYVCKRFKPKEQYANRQLQRYKDNQYNPYAPNGRTKGDPKTTCRACTPAQTTELTCCICTKTKGLDGFAKNQRKNPDHARCIKCVQMHLDTEPDVEVPDSDDYTDSSESEQEDDFDAPESTKMRTSATMANGCITECLSQLGLEGAHNNSQPVHTGVMAATFMNSNTACSTSSSLCASSDAEDDQWETVPVAGNTIRKCVSSLGRESAKPSTGITTIEAECRYGRYGGSRYGGVDPMPTKKNGWAVIDKIHKGKEKKWGEELEDDAEDEWNAYGRQIREKREGKKFAGKKAAKREANDDNGDDDECL